MTQEIINPFNRVDFDMCEHVEHHPFGTYVEWQNVMDYIADGITLRRFMRLCIAGANGDPVAVKVLASMEGNNPAAVDDLDVTEELLREFLREMMYACDRERFTNAAEAQEVEAVTTP